MNFRNIGLSTIREYYSSFTPFRENISKFETAVMSCGDLLDNLLKWCLGLFLTMLPCIAAMWAITVLFEKPLLSVGLNLLLVIPGVLVANTPLWIVYPYCYSGYLVSCSLHDFTAETSDAAFSMFPFLLCAIVVFGLFFALAVTQFGKKEMR